MPIGDALSEVGGAIVRLDDVSSTLLREASTMHNAVFVKGDVGGAVELFSFNARAHSGDSAVVVEEIRGSGEAGALN
jgi:hypothetical protein